jgi:hypothetical protein
MPTLLAKTCGAILIEPSGHARIVEIGGLTPDPASPKS